MKRTLKDVMKSKQAQLPDLSKGPRHILLHNLFFAEICGQVGEFQIKETLTMNLIIKRHELDT